MRNIPPTMLGDDLPTVYFLDKFDTPELQEVVTRLLEDSILTYNLHAQAVYFAAERVEHMVRLMWYPRADIDCIAQSRGLTIDRAIMFVAREARDIYDYSYNLMERGIRH